MKKYPAIEDSHSLSTSKKMFLTLVLFSSTISQTLGQDLWSYFQSKQNNDATFEPMQDTIQANQETKVHEMNTNPVEQLFQNNPVSASYLLTEKINSYNYFVDEERANKEIQFVFTDNNGTPIYYRLFINKIENDTICTTITEFDWKKMYTLYRLLQYADYWQLNIYLDHWKWWYIFLPRSKENKTNKKNVEKYHETLPIPLWLKKT